MTPDNNFSSMNASLLTKFLNFDSFITGTLIKIVYVVGAALIVITTIGGGGIMTLAGLYGALSANNLGMAFFSIMYFIVCIISGLLGLLLLRVYCEVVMVIFKINDNLQVIRDHGTMR